MRMLVAVSHDLLRRLHRCLRCVGMYIRDDDYGDITVEQVTPPLPTPTTYAPLPRSY
jgi:hypothetical protein